MSQRVETNLARSDLRIGERGNFKLGFNEVAIPVPESSSKMPPAGGFESAVTLQSDACDADLDNDGEVGASDFFGVFRPCLGREPVAACAKADLDRDGTIGEADFFGRLRPVWGAPPGPGSSEPV